MLVKQISTRTYECYNFVSSLAGGKKRCRINSLSHLAAHPPDIPLQQSSISSTLLDLQRLQALGVSILPLADVLRDGDPVLPLQVLFMSRTEQHFQGDNRALPRRRERHAPG